MKKIVIAALVLCLLAGGVLGFTLGKDGTIKAPAATSAPVETAEPEAAEVSGLDYEALYALHDPAEIVMTAYGRDIRWDEYFYYLYRQCTSIEDYFKNMAMYGMPLSWGDVAEGENETYADLAVESAANVARGLAATASFTVESGAVLTDAERAEIEEKVQSDIAAVCGEGATREDLNEYLKTLYMPVELYDYMNEISVLYQSGFNALYGENGEKLSEEEAMAWLNDNGYMSANHILLMTKDPATQESLDDAAKAEKLAKAEEIAAELQAIEDRDELMARFAELKAEFDEDTGKVAYPDGYVFQPGEMVAEFEDAVKAQEPYQVSDPVESAYGYHVIMTLPLDVDSVLQHSSTGAELTARSMAANEAYSNAADAYALSEEIAFAEGFEEPDLLAFVR